MRRGVKDVPRAELSYRKGLTCKELLQGKLGGRHCGWVFYDWDKTGVL